MPAPRRVLTDPSELGEVLDFLRLLWAIEHLLKSTSKRMQRRLGITGPQRLVLRVVEQFPGIGGGELAGILHLHPSTLTGVIARLVRRKLLIRERDALDARRIRLRPVQRGSASPPFPTIEAAVKDGLARVSPTQVRQASAVLNAIVASLEAHAEGPPAARGRRSRAAKTGRNVRRRSRA